MWTLCRLPRVTKRKPFSFLEDKADSLRNFPKNLCPESLAIAAERGLVVDRALNLPTRALNCALGRTIQTVTWAADGARGPISTAIGLRSTRAPTYWLKDALEAILRPASWVVE